MHPIEHEGAYLSLGVKMWHNKAICDSEVADEEKSSEVESRVLSGSSGAV